MALFSFTGHIAGLMGLPRRVFATDYAGAPQAEMWHTLTIVSALGGVVLVIRAYAVPIWDVLHLTRCGSPGFKPF